MLGMFLQTAIPCNIPICGRPADMSLLPGASFMAARNFKACQNDPFLILYLYDLSSMMVHLLRASSPEQVWGIGFGIPVSRWSFSPKSLNTTYRMYVQKFQLTWDNATANRMSALLTQKQLQQPGARLC